MRVTRFPRVSRRGWFAAAGISALAIAGVAAFLLLVWPGGGPSGEPPAEIIERSPPAPGWSEVNIAPLDETYDLHPTKTGAAGMAVTTAFVIESAAKDLDPEALPRLLRVDPPIEYTLDGKGGRKLTLRPAAPLREETTYRFVLLDASDGHQVRTWAYQTESPLRVAQTLPADRAVTAPLDTGIELTFSHDGVTGVEERFSIDPPVEGRFETHKRVVVFIPKKLDPQTIYTVTVDRGVRIAGADLKMAEAFTFAFETGTADRDQGQAYPELESVVFARQVYEASTTEAPVMQVSWLQPSGDTALPVTVYRYPDLDGFLEALAAANQTPTWSLWGRRNFRLDHEGLDRVASLRAELVQPPHAQYGAWYAVFPEALPEGFYLVEAARDDVRAQALLQVTDLAAYASISETSTLVWVNDLATGGPADGARVGDGSRRLGQTGADGVALFDTPESLLDGDRRGPEALVVEHDGRVAVVPLGSNYPLGATMFYSASYATSAAISAPPYETGGSSAFWSYVYTDRRLYRKSDEINFWGVARRREGFEPGETLTVRLTGGPYYGLNYQPPVLAETTAQVSDLGTFEGRLSFSGAAAGGYQLEVHAGDQIVATAYVQAQDFVKPAYRLDVTPSRRAAIAGEVVTFDITTEFFDGSPAPYVEVGRSGPEFLTEEDQRLITDADGRASISYVARADDPFAGQTYRHVSAYTVGPEEGELYAQTSLIVLPAAVTIDVESEVEAGVATLRGTVNHVDLAALERGDAYRAYDYYGTFAGDPAPGRRVTAEVTEVTYRRIEVGERYDFVAKIVRKEYSYEATERRLDALAATSGAAGEYSVAFPVEKGKSYRVKLTVQDDVGRVAGTQAWVSGDDVPYTVYQGEQGLQITEARNAPDQYVYGASSGWSIGEQVDLVMRRGAEIAGQGGAVRYLYFRARQGLRGYAVQEGPRFVFDFGANDIPNVYVLGVQFNGRGYEAASGPYNASYDFEDRRIDVVVTPEHERYRPGEEVTLSVETRDAEGRSVAAEVLLSAVDDAIFSLQGDYERDILANLYRSLPSGVLLTYVTSHAATAIPGPAIPAPATGGITPPNTAPGPDVRSEFKDMALFRAVRTDDGGRGSVTFRLPDNITSWRITSRAVTANLEAGFFVTSVPVGLPFFVDVTMSGEYLAADRPVIALRAFGRALERGDQVTYRVSIPSLGVAEAAISGEAFQRAEFALPPLAEGEHEMTVEGRAGEMADAVARTIRVVSSRLRRGEAWFYTLEEGVSLEGAADGRTRVVFSDYNRGRYYGHLLRLSWTFGDRLDQMLARNLSQELLRAAFENEPFAVPAVFDARLYQTDDGGLALFPYAGDDLVLSARAVSAAPDRFERARLGDYFRSTLDDPRETRERSIIALFGLASVSAPVLPSIDRFAAGENLTHRERLYLGLAALAAGDEAAAREQYRQVMLRFGEQREPYVRVRVGVDQDDILEATALAADLAAGLGDPLAPGLFEYTMNNQTTDTLIELEQVSYLSRALPRLSSEPVRFSYELRGRREEQTLEAGRTLTLDLTPDELAELDPRALEGNIGVATFFETPLDAATAAVDLDVALTRTIGGGAEAIREGDLVEIRLDYTLAPQALDGCYQVTDLAPSGLRPVTSGSRAYGAGGRTMPYLVDGQRVSFCVFRTAEYAPPTYYARVVSKGTYLAEPATIQSQKAPDSFNLTPPEVVEIR